MPNLPVNLEEWLEYIQACHPQTIDMGLTRIKAVGEMLSLFSFSCPVITVAGTNGKGSTVAVLAKLLKTAGLRVGCYTSPHLIHFRERIQIDGQFVNVEALCAAFERIEAQRKDTPLTFFEFSTLVAFEIFQHAVLDVLILEVGLGGRLDAVNAVDPNLAIITAIDLDHQEWLGHTREDIAREKAGILRNNIPVVLSKEACLNSLIAQTKTLNNPVYIEDRDFCITQDRIYSDKTQKIALGPCELPLNSVALAFATYTILGEKLLVLPPLQNLVGCLDMLAMVGRFQEISHSHVPIIMDVAHNPHGALWLAQKLKQRFGQQKGIAVWASMHDKDMSQMVAVMKPHIHTWCIGQLAQERAASCETLQAVLQQQDVHSIYTCASIEAAFELALSGAKENEFIVVFGSFFTLAPLLERGQWPPFTLENQGLIRINLAKGWH